MPPSNYIDLTGQRFDRLIVQGRAPMVRNWVTKWICLCDCGNVIVTQGRLLREHKTKSCGCLRSDNTALLTWTHGQRYTPEYSVFRNMKYRCNNPNCSQYAGYGGRGIKVQWRSFAEFYADMGPRPTPKHTIERRDNDAHYCKENCYWATRIEQANNKRNNKLIPYQGQLFTLAQLSRHLGLTYSCLATRISRGKFVP